jgi:hypothetical protein
MIKRALALALVGATLSIPGAVSPASATPCDQGTFKDVWKGRVFVFDRVPGEDSVYNNPGGGTTMMTVNYGLAVTKSVSKHWEVSAGGGVNWGVVKADISGKYGRTYVNAATTSKGFSLTVPVKDNHTAWVRAIFYRRVVYWKSYTWRWDASQQRCEKRTINKAYWGDPKRQYVVVQKKGHRFP